jgi:hypothetical protein
VKRRHFDIVQLAGLSGAQEGAMDSCRLSAWFNEGGMFCSGVIPGFQKAAATVFLGPSVSQGAFTY